MLVKKKPSILGLILIVAFLVPLFFMPAQASAAAPAVTTEAATDVDEESATLNGRLTSDGTYDVVEYGFYYDDSSTVSPSDDNIVAGLGDLDDEEAFDAVLDELDSDTRYYFRAYIIYEDSGGDPHTILASSTRYFTTREDGDTSEDRPTVITRSASSIDYNEATLNGEIESIGGDDITEYGFYWGTSSSTNNKKRVGTGIDEGDEFDYDLSGLSSDRKYYFKAYAKNSYGTDYGALKSFTTDSRRGSYDEDRPNVTTKTPETGAGYAILKGVLSDEGDSDINSYGFYWGTNSSPSTRVEAGYGDLSEDESFSYKLTGLSAGTTYYVKAYAANDSGTDYGSVLSFTVSGAALSPSIFTIGSNAYYINGIYRIGEVAPYLKNNRTYLPIRYVAYGLGITDVNILWDELNQIVTLSKGSTVVRLIINSPFMFVNGSPVLMDTAPEITNNRTCLPVAPVVQAFGYTADWNPYTQTTTIR